MLTADIGVARELYVCTILYVIC